MVPPGWAPPPPLCPRVILQISAQSVSYIHSQVLHVKNFIKTDLKLQRRGKTFYFQTPVSLKLSPMEKIHLSFGVLSIYTYDICAS